jgi:hypothetical protein
LKGLNIDGVGAANNGIQFNTGGVLNVFDCTIKNTLDNGIYVSVLNGMSLLVSNTFISNINSVTNSSGIYLYNGAPFDTLIAVLDHVTVSQTSVGVSLYTDTYPLRAMIKDSEIITNTVGFEAQGIGSSLVYLTLKNLMLTDNQSINLQGNTAVYLSQVVDAAPGSGVHVSSTDHVYCDGTNHFVSGSSPCNGTWAAQ